MSSQIPTQSQPTTGAEATRQGGRVRRPSEKVQAMRDDETLAKRTAEQQMRDKAERRKVLARKREQASQAAKIDPLMAPTPFVSSRGNLSASLSTDSAFTARSVEGVAAATPNTRPHILATALALRKHRVPPAPIRAGVDIAPQQQLIQAALVQPLATQPSTKNSATKDTTTPLPRALAETPTRGPNLKRPFQLSAATPRALAEIPSEAPSLKRLQSYFNVVEDPVRDQTATMFPGGKKRARERSTLVPFDQQSDDEGDVDNAPKPRKRIHHTAVIPDDEVQAESLTAVEGQIASAAGGSNSVEVGKGRRTRGKASDYDLGTRGIIETAIEIYCGLLLNNNPYPVQVQEVEWARSAWELACRHHKVNQPLEATVLKLITARSSHIRSQFKSRARSIIINVYGFEISANPATVNKNRDIFLELRHDNAYIYRTRGQTLNDHRGIYMSPAIQQVINEVLFKNKADGGIRWPKYYNPFPLAGYALAVTAIEAAINEWEFGTRVGAYFKEHEYSGVCGGHLGSLEDIQAASGDVVTKMMQQVYKNGCAHAGIPDTANLQMNVPKKAISSRALEMAIEEFMQTDEVETEPEDIAGVGDYSDGMSGIEDEDDVDVDGLDVE